MQCRPTSRLLSLALSAALLPAAASAASFVNGLAIPGSLLDLSGGTTVNNGRVGFFSDIYYDRNRNEWWGLSDRGPGGGTLDYATRAQRFTLDVDANTGAISNFKIVQTVVFSSNGSPLNGIAPSPVSNLGLAHDPEGLVVLPKTGNLLVSDEYGPSVREFTRSGELVRTYITPANLIPRSAGTGTPNFASDTGNTAGKRTNRGFEGLAVSPDGNYAYAVLQSATLDEGGGNGSINRIVKFDTSTGKAVAQYAYAMKRSGQGQGVSALVAINDHEFYVLERNNRGVGIGADFATADKEVYRIDLAGATDVTSLNLATAPAASYAKVSKSGQVIDLDANTLAALGNKSPEKWEGLAIGPKLSNGSYLVLAGTDNDYSVTQNGSGTQFDVYLRFSDADPYATSIQCPLGQTTGCTGALSSVPGNGSYQLLPGVLHAYTVSAAELGAFQAPVPEPTTWGLMGAGLLGMAAYRRRRA
ncbi:esterase-like activity of phytase family protein [Roseateles paludis]|uniref:Esterase-like activity of phytase family protein n=1 Tax=Roseateles paludis TaxID=3145238 RepID=A0ABV0G4P9_9BURK